MDDMDDMDAEESETVDEVEIGEASEKLDEDELDGDEKNWVSAGSSAHAGTLYDLVIALGCLFSSMLKDLKQSSMIDSPSSSSSPR